MHELPTRLWQLHTSLDDIAAALDYERMLFFTIVSTRAYVKITYKDKETKQYPSSQLKISVANLPAYRPVCASTSKLLS